jgi:PKD repeat protein
MGNSFVAVVVNEAADGDADHNGDGDAVDDVLFAFSLVSPNAAPVADSGGPYAGSVGVPVLFSSSGSVDSDGTIVAYEWTFGDGEFSTLEKPTHVYAAEGTYPVTLTVTDNDGATDVATTEAVIGPFNELPVADANGPYSALLGELVYFSSDGSVDPDGSVRSYEWAFGDGTTATGVRNTVHLYSAVGTYTATLKVIDDRGGSDTDTAKVTITPVDENPFVDDDGSVFEDDIEWLANSGITRGCNPPMNDRFCPESYVTRGQMAAFLVRALSLTDQLDDPFVDDDDSIFEADIEKLAAAGITKGCNPQDGNTKFCPDNRVTRGQMAAFLVRALGYADDGSGNLFIDDDDSIFEHDIDCLGTAGVTKGCNPGEGNTKFCPDSNVTRGQMAAFLHRALG